MIPLLAAATITEPSLTQYGVAAFIGSCVLNLIFSLIAVALGVATFFRRTPPLEGQFLDQKDHKAHCEEQRKEFDDVWENEKDQWDKINASLLTGASMSSTLEGLRTQLHLLDQRLQRILERRPSSKSGRLSTDTQNLR